jgi:curved DNA-binding protein CbpA
LPGATEEEIDAAFRENAKRAHPDAGGSTAMMAELNEARRKLKGQAA